MAKFAKQQLTTTSLRVWSSKEIGMYGEIADHIVDTINAADGTRIKPIGQAFTLPLAAPVPGF